MKCHWAAWSDAAYVYLVTPPPLPLLPGGHSHQLRACEESRRSLMSLIEVNSWRRWWQVFFPREFFGRLRFHPMNVWERSDLTHREGFVDVWVRFRNFDLTKVKRQRVIIFYQAKVSSRRGFNYSILLTVLFLWFPIRLPLPYTIISTMKIISKLYVFRKLTSVTIATAVKTVRTDTLCHQQVVFLNTHFFTQRKYSICKLISS